MCSIFGAYGPAIDEGVLAEISERAKDRGRDGGRTQSVTLHGGMKAVVGHWRATPTTEAMEDGGQGQPFEGIVHNGTIANDRELGNPEGAIDSAILPSVLDRMSFDGFVRSLSRLKGSFALAAIGYDSVYLAANYKPIHFLEIDGTVYFSSMERHLAVLAPFGSRPARVMPYTALNLRNGEVRALKREQSNKALVIASAGLDSTTAAYKLKADGYDVTLLHFLYGCKAETREAELVQQIANDLGCGVVFLPLDYSQFKGTSPLLTDNAISEGVAGAEFAHEWVPARNLLMIANAVAYAEANGYGAVALGNNLEEGGAFPDNEEQFTTLLNDAIEYAVHDGGRVQLLAPVGNLMKHEIVRLGRDLNVRYDLTWSCYRGGEHHCGECGPCYMRKEAFARNNLVDPVFA